MRVIIFRLGARVLLLAALVFPVGHAGAAELLWYGQAAVRITTPGGKVIVIDPFITKNPKTPEALKDLATVGPVDLILLTHGHGDHIGDAPALAEMTGAKVALNADMGQTLAALGWIDMGQMIRFNKSGPIQPLGEGVTITMVHAKHSSSVRAKDAETGAVTVHPGGEPSGYVIELEDGYTIYHAGDTGVFGDMAFIGAYYEPDLALLPIGGHFTMDPAHAAYAARNLLEVETIVPIHYGTFPPLKGTPEEFIAALGNSPAKVVVLAPGDALAF
jgi:L-ascorbate metabolism protein UlaG (beta-lactamase superfamily)